MNNSVSSKGRAARAKAASSNTPVAGSSSAKPAVARPVASATSARRLSASKTTTLHGVYRKSSNPKHPPLPHAGQNPRAALVDDWANHREMADTVWGDFQDVLKTLAGGPNSPIQTLSLSIVTDRRRVFLLRLFC